MMIFLIPIKYEMDDTLLGVHAEYMRVRSTVYEINMFKKNT